MDRSAIDKARRLSVYWRFDPLKRSDSPTIPQMVGAILDSMEHDGVQVPSEGKYRDGLTEHIHMVLCNLLLAFSEGSSIYIDFSRDSTSYSGTGVSYRNVKKVTDYLINKGFVTFDVGRQDKREGKSGYRSKMQATHKLMAMVETIAEDSDPVEVYRDTSNEETVVLKGVKKGKGKHKTRDILKTPDKPVVRQMRQNLAVINEVLQKAHIDLDLDLQDLDILNSRLSQNPDKYKRPVDFTEKHLYRVFVDRSLELHGRFYGGWWEGIPEEYRELIVINGNTVAELDFKALHPHILYCLEGAALPTDDPYKLEGYPDTKPMRTLLKRFLLMIVNAKNAKGAKGALRQAYKKDLKKAYRLGLPIPELPIPITDEYLDPIIPLLRERHSPIQHRFFSSMGNELMYHDSQIAEEVLLHFARRDIPALPVHDSFVIEEQHVDECLEVMREAFFRRFGQQIPIDATDLMVRAQHILKGPVVGKKGEYWKLMEDEILTGIHDSDLDEDWDPGDPYEDEFLTFDWDPERR